MGNLLAGGPASERVLRKRFAASREERRRRLQKLLGEREVGLHVVPRKQEGEQAGEDARLKQAVGAVGADIGAHRGPHLLFVEDEWDGEEEEEDHQQQESREGRQGLEPDKDGSADSDEDSGDDSAVEALARSVRNVLAETGDADIPFSVLRKVARAISPGASEREPAGGDAEGTVAQQDKDQGTEQDTEQDTEGATSSTSQGASDTGDESLPAASPPPPPAEVLAEHHPLSFALEELSFLSDLTPRNNRKALLRGELVELHVVKLTDFAATARYQQEYRDTLRALQHPNLIKICGLCKRKENLFVVAAGFLESTLAELHTTGYRIPYQFALRFAFQLCKALQYYHRNGLAHLDVSASNIFFDAKHPPNLFLLDTGTGRAFQGPQFSHGAVQPPEKRDKGAAADIYMLGFVLWEMLSGISPQSLMDPDANDDSDDGAAEGGANEGDFDKRCFSDRRPPLLAVAPGCHSLLEACWAADPASRPSVDEVLLQLKELILKSKTEATPGQVVPAAMAPATPPAATGRLHEDLTLDPNSAPLRRARRLEGRHWVQVLASMAALQDVAAQTEARANLAAAGAKNAVVHFRGNCAVGIKRLALWRVEALCCEPEEAPAHVQRLAKLQSLLMGRPGLCIAKTVHVDRASATPVSLLLEYANGCTLADVVARGGCPHTPLLQRVAWAVLKGLSWMHRFNLLHGSLSPRHILLDRFGVVSITGFDSSRQRCDEDGGGGGGGGGGTDRSRGGRKGEGKDTDTDTEWRLQTGEFGFFSPETILEDRATPAGDIWSLGMCLWSCATGYVPLQDVTDFRKAKECANNFSMTPNVAKEDLPPAFKAFVSLCMASDSRKRPAADRLLCDPFLADFQDYPGTSKSGSDPDETDQDALPALDNELLAPSALALVERLITHSELQLISRMVLQHNADGFSLQDVNLERFAERLSSAGADFVRSRFKAALRALQREMPQSPAAVAASAVDLDKELESADIADLSTQEGSPLFERLCAAGRCSKIALVRGGEGDAAAALASVLRRSSVQLVDFSMHSTRARNVLLASGLPQIHLVEAAQARVDHLLDIAVGLADNTDHVLFVAWPDVAMALEGDDKGISDVDLREQIYARISLALLAQARGGVHWLGGHGLEDAVGLDELLCAVVSEGAKRTPYDEYKCKYDVFIGCTPEGDGTGLPFSQVLVSWLATKPGELVLAYARGSEAENATAHLERLISLELVSSVLFYTIPGDARGYSVLLRAAAHAVAGKRLVLVFGQPDFGLGQDGRNMQAARNAFFRHIEPYRDHTVFIFDAGELDEAMDEAMDEAIEKAVDLSMGEADPLLDTLAAFEQEAVPGPAAGSPRPGSQIPRAARGALLPETASVQPEIEDALSFATMVGLLGAVGGRLGSEWTPPRGILEKLGPTQKSLRTMVDSLRGAQGPDAYHAKPREAAAAFRQSRPLAPAQT